MFLGANVSGDLTMLVFILELLFLLGSAYKVKFCFFLFFFSYIDSK